MLRHRNPEVRCCSHKAEEQHNSEQEKHNTITDQNLKRLTKNINSLEGQQKSQKQLELNLRKSRKMSPGEI